MQEQSRKFAESLASVLARDDIHDADLLHPSECECDEDYDQKEDHKRCDESRDHHRRNFRFKKVEGKVLYVKPCNVYSPEEARDRA